MKKFYLLTLLLSFVFIGCNKDDDGGNNNNSAQVIDSWKLIGWVDNEVTPPQFHPEEECYSEVITFNDNNTGTVVINDCDAPAENTSFSWAASGNGVYTLQSGGLSETINISFPEGNDKMYVTYPGDGPDADIYQRQ